MLFVFIIIVLVALGGFFVCTFKKDTASKLIYYVACPIFLFLLVLFSFGMGFSFIQNLLGRTLYGLFIITFFFEGFIFFNFLRQLFLRKWKHAGMHFAIFCAGLILLTFLVMCGMACQSSHV
ncbi:MAG: hypothetical protein EBR02_00500 [Alphaproteobacteria bacterium]|nr:hypothetical protein [Alphaproteobacteria bacterium]